MSRWSTLLSNIYSAQVLKPGGFRGVALNSTSFTGHLQIMRSSLRHGVGVDVHSDDSQSRTPLLLHQNRVTKTLSVSD